MNLRRKIARQPKFRDKAAKKGTAFRRVRELGIDPRDGSKVPDTHELMFHATKGYRYVRKAV